MPISVFPAAVTSSSPSAKSITATTSNVLYEGLTNFDPAIYTITCVSSTLTRIEFWNGQTILTNTETLSGTVTINLGSTADRVRLWTDTGTNVVITITQIASAVSGTTISGTLDIITSSGTYTGTSTSGYGYAIVVGGGGGGAGGAVQTNVYRMGSGGGGGSSHKYVQLNGSMSVTVGAAGTGAPAAENNSPAGNAGGQSTFAGLTANGGNGGIGKNTFNAGNGGSASGGTYNLSGNSGVLGNNGFAGSPNNVYKFIVNAIGTGGDHGNFGNANGYGAGGAGGFASQTGKDGTPGVVYVLKV